MDPSSPITLAAAGYSSPVRALADYATVWEARHDRPFHHSCLAVVLQDRLGTSWIERSDNTAECLTWGDGVLGAALSVLLPRMATSAPAIGTRGGQEAFIGHFRRHVDVADLVSAALLLDDSPVGLVVVVLNLPPSAVLPLLAHAARTEVIGTRWADLEDDLGRDLARGVSEPALASCR
jgi:hypothetical protein